MSGTNDPWKKIPFDLRDRTATRVLDANDPQILVEWKPGNQQWSSLRRVRVQDDGRVFWRNNQRPTGLLVERAPVQSLSSFTQGMEDLTIDIQAAIPHTSLIQNMDALNIDSPPSYGLLSNSISVNANLSNVDFNGASPSVDFNGASPSVDFNGASPSARDLRVGCPVCLLQVGVCASGLVKSHKHQGSKCDGSGHRPRNLATKLPLPSLADRSFRSQLESTFLSAVATCGPE